MRNYEKESDLRELPLAMAYVPWQHLDRIYENLEYKRQIWKKHYALELYFRN